MQEQSKLILLKAFARKENSDQEETVSEAKAVKKETTKSETVTRPAWMNDGQYAIYVEMKRLSEAMFEALLVRDREKWLNLSLRMREISRMVHDDMFAD
jgi:hypothetical protein